MMPLKIDGLWAWIATEDGQEGLIGIQTASGWAPLIGADRARVEALRDKAQEIADLGTVVTLIQLTERTDVERLTCNNTAWVQ